MDKGEEGCPGPSMAVMTTAYVHCFETTQSAVRLATVSNAPYDGV